MSIWPLTEPNRFATMPPNPVRACVHGATTRRNDWHAVVARGARGCVARNDANDTSEVSRATAVLRAVDETGVNWVDTSENYFDTGNESVISIALQEMPDSFLVCSKVHPGPYVAGAGPASALSKSAARVR